MKECPNQGFCSCPQHAAGLLAYAKDIPGYLTVLRAAGRDRPSRLAVVPLRENPAPVYHGDKPQPWEVRPARLRRAA